MSEDEGGRSRALVPALTAGAVVGLVEVVFASSFAALIFGGQLADRVAAGVGMNLAAAAVILAVMAVLGGARGIVGSTQDSPAAVLAVVAAAVAARVIAGPEATFLTVVATIVLTTTLTGVVLLLLGLLRLGNLVRFVPYPVVGGFLAGTGWLLAKGSFDVMTSIPPTIAHLDRLAAADAVRRWLPGVALGVLLLLLTRRMRGSLTIPAVLAAGTVGFYVAVLAFGSIDEAEDAGWLLGPFPGSELWRPWVTEALPGADLSAIAGQAGGIATVVFVAVLALLLNASGTELVVGRDLDLNRELRSAGVANLGAGLAGGVPGFHALSITTLAYRMSADGRATGLIAAGVCAAAAVFGASALSLFPRAVLGGLLLFLGLGFLAEWVIDARRKLPGPEYAIVLAILVAIAVWGLLPGVAVGLVLAVVLFAVNYSRTELVRNTLNVATYRSNVDRAPDERRALNDLGERVHILKLQGFVFFGTANSLLDRIRQRAGDPTLEPLRFLVLDFRRVTGIDSSAVLSFQKASQLAVSRGFQLVLTAVPSQVRTQLELGGVREDHVSVAYPADLDRGVQRCEDALLREAVAVPGAEDPSFWDLVHVETTGDGGVRLDPRRLEPYLERLEVGAGDVLIQQGAAADDLFLLESGRLTVELRTDQGETLRLRTMGPGTVVGEISLYLGGTRTASVTTEVPSVVRRLRRDALARLEREDPELAAALHRWLARLLADRLSEILRTVDALLD